MDQPETTDNGHEGTGIAKTSWGLTEVAMGIVFTIIFGFIAIQIYLAFGDPDRTTTMPAIFAGVVGGWIGFYGTSILVAKNLPGGVKEQLGLKFDLPGDIWRGVLFGIAGQILVALVFLPLQAIDPKLTENISGPAEELTNDLSSWRWFLFLFFVSVVTPVGEELFFRGLALRAMISRWGVPAGIIASSVLFGLVHFQKLQTLGLIAFGILLAVRAVKTGRIGETIVAHGVFNGLTVLALFLGVT